MVLASCEGETGSATLVPVGVVVESAGTPCLAVL